MPRGERTPVVPDLATTLVQHAWIFRTTGTVRLVPGRRPLCLPIQSVDPEAVAPLLRSLLADRFQMKYHTEERPLSAYVLVAAKPKMKKADPASRAWCRNDDGPEIPPGSRGFQCQNITMAQFAERLQNLAPGLNWPVSDALMRK